MFASFLLNLTHNHADMCCRLMPSTGFTTLTPWDSMIQSWMVEFDDISRATPWQLQIQGIEFALSSVWVSLCDVQPVPQGICAHNIVLSDEIYVGQSALQSVSLDSWAQFRGLRAMWQLDAPPAERMTGMQPQYNCQTLAPGVRGKDYAGRVDVSRSGRACLPWAGMDAISGGDFAVIAQESLGSACRYAPLNIASDMSDSGLAMTGNAWPGS